MLRIQKTIDNNKSNSSQRVYIVKVRFLTVNSVHIEFIAARKRDYNK